ncbi:MAG: DUF177 domain-containing protein [Clostridia bacterium]|nr:DUF177 domain-containing protein [Clostridia bacterium]
MVLDMRPMLRGEVERIAINYMLTPELPMGVTSDSDAHVEGFVTDEAGYMRLSLTATVSYHTECARCLELVGGEFAVTLERTVAAEGTLTEQQLEENVDEYAVIEDGTLDLDETIREELLLSFPMRIFCSEDCPGLCPKCGKPRRLGDCGCPTFEPDPRLAILKTLFDKDEEENQ